MPIEDLMQPIKVNTVYMHLGATVLVPDQACPQILTYALQQLKQSYGNLRTLYDFVEKEKILVVKGKSVVSSPSDFADSFVAWLETYVISLSDKRPVMWKQMFVFSGDAQNPVDGSKFTWNVSIYVD